MRLLLLLLSASCAALNASSSAIDLGASSPSLAASVTVGAYIIVVLFAVTALMIVGGFGRSIYLIAVAEAGGAERDALATMAVAPSVADAAPAPTVSLNRGDANDRVFVVPIPVDETINPRVAATREPQA